MYRLAPRLFNALAALLLLLCAATVALWVRSQTTQDRVTHHGPEYVRKFASDSGRILVSRVDNRRTLRDASEMRRNAAEHPEIAREFLGDPSIINILEMARPHWERHAFPAWQSSSFLMPPPSRIGFAVARRRSGGDRWEDGLWIVEPRWALFILTSVFPAIWIACVSRTLGRKHVGCCPSAATTSAQPEIDVPNVVLRPSRCP